MTRSQRSKTQGLGWTADQLVHLSRSLEMSYGHGNIRRNQAPQPSPWTTEQRLRLSEALAKLL